ncbi:Trp biosynthesis-associated membrane protein [Microbacterium soli]|uniref:Peptidase n=1 Tax=Microbacterium soli TaxID=446075 RepID=A0ABP7NGF1_9MICO
MIRRARLCAVLGFLLAGGVGVISATQTWISVTRTDGGEPLLVPGADAMPLLTALSLAVLALGAALSIAGTVLRHVLAGLGILSAVVLATGTFPIMIDPPLSTAASALTAATGLSGETTLRSIVDDLQPGGWPVAALCAWVLLLASSVFVLVTGRRWRVGSRRYEQLSDGRHTDAGPLDAVDSWDELSHGSDPTGPSR